MTSARSSDAPRDTEPIGQARWARVAQSLRQRVVDGEWKAGEAIPAESALAHAYGVALGTMRTAIQALVEGGLLEREQGRGTFVRGAIAGASLARFFRWGAVGADELPESRVRKVRRVVAGEQVARALGIAPAASVLRLARHRVRAGRVLLHESIWLPLPLFAPLEALTPSKFGPLLYPMYAQRCGVTVHRALDDLSFATLDARVAAALGLPTGHPAIRVARRAFDLAGRPVEYRITFGDANEFRYQAEVR